MLYDRDLRLHDTCYRDPAIAHEFLVDRCLLSHPDLQSSHHLPSLLLRCLSVRLVVVNGAQSLKVILLERIVVELVEQGCYPSTLLTAVSKLSENMLSKCIDSRLQS